jgi:hypothetical protein
MQFVKENNNMNSMENLTTFFGWYAVLNIGFLALTFLVVTVMRSTIIRVHCALFGVSEPDLPGIYFRYLANYQTVTLALAVFPYIALKLMQ